MRFFLIFLITVVFFNGCSSNNAFDHFNMTDEQEMAQESIRSVKLQDADKTVGVCNIVYLNNVLPNKYKTKDSFYIYMYTHHNYRNFKFFLDKSMPISIKKLPKKNQFQKFTKESYRWQNYFIVEFKKINNEKLNFEITNKDGISKTIMFEMLEY